MLRVTFVVTLLVALACPCLAEDPQSATLVADVVGADGAPASAHVLAHASFIFRGGPEEAEQDVKESASLSLAPGEWAVSACAPGLASEPTILFLDPKEAAHVVLHLAPAGMIAGRATRPDGMPAAGARVRGIIVTTRSGSNFSAEEEAVCAAATSDADGRYELGVRPGPVYPYAEGGGLVSLCGRVEVAKGEKATCDLPLVEGKAISGHVLDRAGHGIAGARILAIVYDHPPGGCVPEFHRDAVSGRDGRYSVEHLPDGNYGIDVRAEGHVREYREKIASGVSDLDLTLKDGGRIEGKVALPAGLPSKNVKVGAVPLTGANNGAAAEEVREDGSFVIKGADPGGYAVVVLAKGFAPAISDPVEVPEGGSVRCGALVLSPGGSLHGRVVAAKDGSPVVEAHVSLGTPSRKSGHWSALDHLLEPVKTDGKGAFEWEDLLPGEYKLTVHHPMYGPRERKVRIEQGKATEIDVELPSAARVYGRVLDAEGKPRRHARVDTGEHGSAEADNEGRYEITGLPPGDLFLTCTAGGEGLGNFDFSQNQHVHLDPGQSLEVNFTSSGGVRVHGVARCGERVLAGGEVAVIPSDGTSRSTRTNEKGEYEFVGLPAGPCHATVKGVKVDLVIPEGVKELMKDFVLPAVSIPGRLRDTATGKPPQFAYVTAYHEGGSSDRFILRCDGSSEVRPDGTFEVIGLKAGKYTVVIRCSPLATEIVRGIEVPEGGSAKAVEVDLVRGGLMRLALAAEEGKPVKEVFLGLWELPSKRRLEIVDPMDSVMVRDGSYELLESLRPGDYVVQVFDHHHLPLGLPVHVVAGEEMAVKGTLRPGGAAILTVKDADGKPVDDGEVVVFDPAGKPLDTSCGIPEMEKPQRGPNGQIGLPLPVGSYRGEVTSGGRKASFEVTIKADEVSQVGVSLPAK